MKREHADRLAVHRPLLLRLAQRYVWWKEPEGALKHPEHLIAQVMNMGIFEDFRELEDALGEEVLQAVVEQAPPGVFSARSWHFWHYRLGLAGRPEQIPSLPERTFH